jgi:hypothetical protein
LFSGGHSSCRALLLIGITAVVQRQQRLLARPAQSTSSRRGLLGTLFLRRSCTVEGLTPAIIVLARHRRPPHSPTAQRSWLLDRQINRVGPLENLLHVIGRPAVELQIRWSIARRLRYRSAARQRPSEATTHGGDATTHLCGAEGAQFTRRCPVER